MTRYDDVIARAVAALPLDAAKRHETYDRMRSAQVERLRSALPPIPEVAIEAEQAALEEAIQRVERRFGDPAGDVSIPPAVGLRLDGGRSGVRVAVLSCLAIVVALLCGFLYAYWGSTGRTAYRQLRQWMGQTGELAASKPTTDSQSGEPVPYVYLRQLVHYRSTNPAGSLVIDKAQRHLYVILANVSAVRYGIALGGNCVEAAGRYSVSRKAEGSEPQSSIARSGSSGTGTRALYLDSDSRLIHGTDISRLIGQSVGMGCFLLMPTDLAELYGRVPVGTRVVVN
jgi:lipoprotein-anchoring transpeptidase ErfK/SrfK